MRVGPRPQDRDTICALASPPGEGAIALIRVSGKEAFSIVKKLCPFLPMKPISHRLYYGTVVNLASKEEIDQVLVSFFKSGRSFTGEESLEISCHGGSFLCSCILKCLILGGARLAEPGEFSYRAFMNGRIDLIQAESILDIIRSRSPVAHKQALKSLKGLLSDRLKKVEKKTLTLLAHIEASLDFSEQDIEVLAFEKQEQMLLDIQEEVQTWLKGFKQSQINKEGFSVLFMGAPNAGKSSLFNCLVEEERAIVSSHSGTTRDILSARFIYGRREFCLKDTAGLRSDPDAIEQQGITKVFEEMQHTDLVVFLIESVEHIQVAQLFGLENIGESQKKLFLFSKSDQLPDSAIRRSFLAQVKKLLSAEQINVKSSAMWVSSKTGEGIEEFKEKILQESCPVSGEIFVSSSRQFEAIEKMNGFFKKALTLLNQKASPDLVSFELREALGTLYALLGKEYDNQVIQRIFKEFCIGK